MFRVDSRRKDSQLDFNCLGHTGRNRRYCDSHTLTNKNARLPTDRRSLRNRTSSRTGSAGASPAMSEANKALGYFSRSENS